MIAKILKNTVIVAIAALLGGCETAEINPSANTSNAAPITSNASNLNYLSEVSALARSCVTHVFNRPAANGILLAAGYEQRSRSDFEKSGTVLPGTLGRWRQSIRVSQGPNSAVCSIRMTTDDNAVAINSAFIRELNGMGFRETSLIDGRGRSYEAFVNGGQSLSYRALISNQNGFISMLYNFSEDRLFVN